LVVVAVITQLVLNIPLNALNLFHSIKHYGIQFCAFLVVILFQMTVSTPYLVIMEIVISEN